MIIRTYRCNDCKEVFDATLENSAEPDPECPFCKITLEWQPASFNIATNKGKAVDIAQKMLERDYGLTDFNDHTKEGETVAKGPRQPTAAENHELMQMASEIEQQNPHLDGKMSTGLTPELQKVAEGFWGNTAKGPPPQLASTLLANAKVGPATGGGDYAIGGLHKLGRAGLVTRVPKRLNPV